MQDRPWWHGAVFYQIYPRSFQDSNGDGVGDLRGIINRLDYLSWLGVEALWLSPIFPSPMVDFGYDVSDYTDIDPLFGTLNDFDQLLAAAHERGIRVILDFVPNHTSDQHPWFVESRASRDNPKRDWFVWHDAKPDGSPPNNWRSEFGGSAWEWDERTEQYYLHTFAVSQPELNWQNPDVVQVMFDVMRFWLDRGIDGFRVDVLHELIKDAELRDDPINPNFDPQKDNPYDELIHQFSGYRPEVHDIVRQMRQVIDEYDDRVLIGEIQYRARLADMRAFYGEGDQVHLPFNFWLTMYDWNMPTLRQFVGQYDASVPTFGFPNYVLGNHDVLRVASRIGEAQVRIAAMLLLTLRGTPFIYYGDELGMSDAQIRDEQVQDVRGMNVYGHSRDPARTPMQWDASQHAGFSTVAPWLPVADTLNVATESEDERSLLNLYRVLITYRRQHPAVKWGTYRLLVPDHEFCWAFLRETDSERVLVALNFSAEAQVLSLPDLNAGEIALSTELNRAGNVDLQMLHLRPHEGCIIELKE